MQPFRKVAWHGRWCVVHASSAFQPSVRGGSSVAWQIGEKRRPSKGTRHDLVCVPRNTTGCELENISCTAENGNEDHPKQPMAFQVDMAAVMHKIALKIEGRQTTCLGRSNIFYFRGPRKGLADGKSHPNPGECNGKSAKCALSFYPPEQAAGTPFFTRLNALNSDM